MKRTPKYTATHNAKEWIKEIAMEKLWNEYAEREKRWQKENEEWHQYQAKKNADK